MDFVVEHWQHAGKARAGEGPAPQFFMVTVSGPRGIWPLRAYIIPPDGNEGDTCLIQESSVDLEIQEHALVEIECPLDDPSPGEYKMRLIIAGQHVADIPFVIQEAAA